jgi:sporulation protein YlmC with PRC-barrel domain
MAVQTRGRSEPRVLSAGTMCGDAVVNRKGEDLGKVEELMIDTQEGRVAYAVLSFGGFLGLGEKLFAVPFEALELDPDEHQFVLDIPRERLQAAPGFDKSDWPDFADRALGTELHDHYGVPAYWARPQQPRK